MKRFSLNSGHNSLGSLTVPVKSMPVQNSSPQLPPTLADYYSRYSSSTLGRYSVKQLKVLAEQKNIDTSGLSRTAHWQYVNVLHEHQLKEDFYAKHRCYEVDPNRPNFLDLPGEIRNRIYEYTLIAENDFGSHGDKSIIYEPSRKRPSRVIEPRLFPSEHDYRHDWETFHGRKGLVDICGQQRGVNHLDLNPSHIVALRNLGMINHAIRQEARSYFYSSNTFKWKLVDYRSYSGDPSVVLSIMNSFFERVTPDAHSHVTNLVLEARREKYKLPYNIYQKLLSSLATCTNLRCLRLDIGIETCVPISRLLYHNSKSYRWCTEEAWVDFVDDRTSVPTVDSSILQFLEHLTKLQELVVYVSVGYQNPAQEILEDEKFTGKAKEMESAIVLAVSERLRDIFGEATIDVGSDSDSTKKYSALSTWMAITMTRLSRGASAIERLAYKKNHGYSILE